MLALIHLAACCLASPPITFESLLSEMTDRSALARFPDPPYTCRQASSYDRASTTPDDPNTWFANGDVNQYIRTETNSGRKEWVMMDTDGPGAIVRLWSANPRGTLRIYLDGAAAPALEAPMADLLGAKWKIGEPLSGVQAKGWNLYLPIPYARHCKVTSDADGFYYQINYRTYPADAAVRTFSLSELTPAVLAPIEKALRQVREPGGLSATPSPLAPGQSRTLRPEIHGSGAVTRISVVVQSDDMAAALRSTILSAEFDGQQTIWCPLGDFFGSGVGCNVYQDWYRSVDSSGDLRCDWVMPFRAAAAITVTNLSTQPVSIALGVEAHNAPFDDRSMHFHATWRSQYPIHALKARGTMDWNYLTASGKGVYVGDSLAVMNPVEAWWGEGDEKIYVDGEKFPSHFGTGTEDYYGYAWCDPHVFQHPFHAQPRADGNGKTNWGHTTVTRTRSLDAIPFTTSFKFDMEVWHWAECDEAYAATTYWYALPGATCNRAPDPEAARAPIPQPPPLPPPFKIDNAIECETMTIAAKSEGLNIAPQDMSGFGRGTWSGDEHLWVQGRKAGDFVELTFKPNDKARGPRRLTLYATKSWDYGIVRFSVNGHPAGPTAGAPIDLFSGQHGKAIASGALDLGVFSPRDDGSFVIRAQVIGGNAKAEGSRSFFGLDCVVATPGGR